MCLENIISTTSNFSMDKEEIECILHQNNFNLIKNPYKKKLSEEELLELLFHYRPAGVLAGLESYTEDIFLKTKSFLRVISRVGIGLDNIDLKAASKFQVQIYRTEDSVTPAVVELVIGMIFDLARKISFHNELIRSNAWEKHIGTLVSGKTMGIIGCGRIGKQIALKMQALGCKIQVYDPFVDMEWLNKYNISFIDALECIFSSSDIISIHIPLMKETFNLINANILKHSKTGLLIINTSRGGVINEKALYDALKTGSIGGAALDVFEQEPYDGALKQLSNVVLTPHIGSYTVETRKEMELKAISNLMEGLKNNRVISQEMMEHRI